MSVASSTNGRQRALPGKLRTWWSKGLVPHDGLSPAVSGHVQAILDHAADIQRSADLEARRTRRDALEAGARMLARVDAAESELEEALRVVREGREALEAALAAERARAEELAPLPPPAALPPPA